MYTLNKKITAIYLTIAVIFISFDRFLKILALKGENYSNISIFKDYFTFNFSPNYNIAFSLPLSGIGLNIVILLIIIGLLYFFAYLLDRKDKNVYYVGFVLLGAISNFYDRIVYGFVIDYLDLKYFTVFNIADIMIVAGCLLILINKFKKENYEY